MSAEILKSAEGYLSEGARSFENVVRRAEESRIEAERRLAEISGMELEWREKLKKINAQIEELNKEKEKINRSARSESRRIVAERTEQAEEMLAQIEEIFKKAELSQADLIAARTLKNKLQDVAYNEENERAQVTEYVQATAENLKIGQNVYIKPMDSRGQVVSFSPKKGEAEVSCGSLKMHVKISDISIIGEPVKTNKPDKIKVVKNLPKTQPILEINVLGMTVPEALYEVDNFIDGAVTDNLEEIKVIHGVGTGKLKKAIAEHLKRHKNVESFRLGKYGEGETGVTFIKLK